MSSVINKPLDNDLIASSFNFEVSDSANDPEWDLFMASSPFGNHVQSSLWAQVKKLNGWSSKRIKVYEDKRIVGGAQLLFRRTRFLGQVGYIPKGPILDANDIALEDELLQRIQTIVTAENIRVFFVQPPGHDRFVERLFHFGFRACPVETAPTATLLVDLSYDLDQIIARMTKSMRNAVRRSQNRGIVVREGTRDDLPAFHRLLSATGRRRGFTVFDLDYYQGMWDILESGGYFKLFLGELNGEAVSAKYCIPFGDRVVAKQIGWSGEHSRLHPNEALDWFALQWSKDHGYRYYDLEGIERPAAQALIDGEDLPPEYAKSPTAYKMKFGGDVHLDPVAYCYVANPVLRAAYNSFGSRILKWSIFQKAISRFRTS